MKTLILASTLIFTLASHAEECPIVPLDGPNKLLKDIGHMMDWHAAKKAQIKKAACKTAKVPSIEEMDKAIVAKGKENSISISRKVAGVELQDEPFALLEAFTKLVTPNKNSDLKQKDFQKEFAINPECKKVACAVEKIWGKDLGKKILYVLIKHNYNASEFVFENSDRFTVDEFNTAILALEDLPPHLIPLGYGYTSGQRFTHFTRGKTLAYYGDQGQNVLANSAVMFFDTWSNLGSAEERNYTAFHELSHNVATKFDDIDETPAWLKLTGWVKKGDEWTAEKTDACYISKYGMTNPYEDWAECLSAYRYNPAKLKERCPDKYKFVKERAFKNIEYTSPELCAKKG